MRMFGNLKKKLNNALQAGSAIGENLQKQYLQRVGEVSATPATTSSSFSSLSESISSSRFSLRANDLDVPADLNMSAGSELLAKYEEDWKAIHASNQENAQKADNIAVQIEKIKDFNIGKQTELSELSVLLSEIPTLMDKVNASMKTLNEIVRLSANVEQELMKLEDLCEECDLQEFKLKKQFELSQYKQKKMKDLEIYRQKVAAEYEERLRKHEQHLLKIQRERQAVFDDAFRSDLEDFKQKGVLPKMNTERKPSVALEEVEVVDTESKDALEEFLNG